LPTEENTSSKASPDRGGSSRSRPSVWTREFATTWVRRLATRRAQIIGALDDYPYLAEIAEKLPGTGYDNDLEFVWGLDLILDGLDRLREP
jgi:hypothetical protein